VSTSFEDEGYVRRRECDAWASLREFSPCSSDVGEAISGSWEEVDRVVAEKVRKHGYGLYFGELASETSTLAGSKTKAGLDTV